MMRGRGQALLGRVDVLKTMMSRTRTMKPMMPPPVPYCQLLSMVLAEISCATGAAKARAARQSWRRRV